nr:MAG TPA: hypothetical protein [Caudoviricetes sp.]
MPVAPFVLSTGVLVPSIRNTYGDVTYPSHVPVTVFPYKV